MTNFKYVVTTVTNRSCIYDIKNLVG